MLFKFTRFFFIILKNIIFLSLFSNSEQNYLKKLIIQNKKKY